ncbi:MAG: hypothetical protein H0U67_09960 [Gemmatimonadetes bacterium]|nr:hypothetical protein [Gemmatimonadota bacterium]
MTAEGAEERRGRNSTNWAGRSPGEWSVSVFMKRKRGWQELFIARDPLPPEEQKEVGEDREDW